jgi:4-amino-4-deoxy-L-arabinose transferase-like glycosyltransferase
MWFPEMARLGNDSLVLLLLSLAWVVTRKAFDPRGKTFHFALLGVVCGLGLLTKATMLPFVAALGLFLTWCTWRARGDAGAVRASASRLVVFCLVTVAIAAWWYANNLIVYGNILGSNDAIALARQGGLLKGLSENFSLPRSILGMVGNIESFLWAATWSFVHPWRVMEIPLIILLVVVAVGWIWHAARAKAISSLDAIAALTLVLFIIALLQHTLVFIALLGAFSPGAWYLHSLAPVLAPWVARGLAEAAAWRRARPLVSALVIYPVLFLPFATALELFYFAGCFDEPSDVAHFGLTVVATCAAFPREVLRHLTVLGNPALALPLFGTGWVAMLIGFALVIRQRFFTPERRVLSPVDCCPAVNA